MNIKRITLLAVLVLTVSAAAAVAQCNSPVWNRAGVSLGSADLAASAAKLTDLGADIHIVIYEPTTLSADQIESSLERECPSWLGPTGVRASTLLVIGVSPAAHRSWIDYGSAWHSALDDHFNRIRVEDMNPAFKNREWGVGLLAGVNALAARITASKDEALHPANTTVEATDLKPVAHVFGVVAEIVGAVAVIWILIAVFIAFGRRKRKAGVAQQLASTVRSALASRLQKLDADVDQYVAAKGANADVVDKLRDRLSEDFARFSNSAKTNPDTAGLSEDEYTAIKDIYTGLQGNLEGCYRMMRPGASPEEYSARATSYSRSARTRMPNPGGKGASLGPATQSQAAPQPASSGFSDGFLGGLIGSELAENRTENVYVAPAPAPTHSYDPPSSSSWGSSDSGGGGGSDWSSSSDSGGGGGSDFGGGGDSGGGGGGDF